MNIEWQAYSDADDRLAMAIAVLDILSEETLRDHGRHISNAVWAARSLIEDAQGMMESGLIRNSQPSESSSEPQSGRP